MRINYDDNFPPSAGSEFADELSSRFLSNKTGINLSLQYLGDWVNTTNYDAYDLVRSGGAYWLALATNIAVTPVEGATWTRFARVSGGGTRTITTSQTVLTTDETLEINATSGNITLTLLAASAQAPLFIQRIDNTANTVTIQRNATPGTDTINGASSTTLTTQWQAVIIRATASNRFGIF